jgi:hypothetical protein
VLLKLAAVAAVALLAAGCGGGSKPSEETTGSKLPPGCEVAGIEATVTGLLTAITAGQGAERFLASGDDFLGVSVVDPDRRFVTKSRAKALRFLRARHRHDENVRLLQMAVSRSDDENHVAIHFVITRVASDLPARGIRSHSASGDGLVNCVSRRVSLFRLAASGG